MWVYEESEDIASLIELTFITNPWILDPRSLARHPHLLHPDEVRSSNCFVVLGGEELEGGKRTLLPGVAMIPPRLYLGNGRDIRDVTSGHPKQAQTALFLFACSLKYARDSNNVSCSLHHPLLSSNTQPASPALSPHHSPLVILEYCVVYRIYNALLNTFLKICITTIHLINFFIVPPSVFT